MKVFKLSTGPPGYKVVELLGYVLRACLTSPKGRNWQRIKEKKMKGYKVFNPDFTCMFFQYEVGKTYEDDLSPECCHWGFHFCKQVKDCFDYYSFNSNNKVAEVEALGEISESGNKCCTNKLHIIRELTWHEVLELVNSGKGCTGIHNSGDSNSGNHNVGIRNSGNHNRGICNTGDFNIGDFNIGAYNVGEYNSGDCNTGDFNKASNVMGCFNTKSQKLKFFDKETDMTLDEWRHSAAYHIISRIDLRPTQWVRSEYMNNEEKTEHPEHKTTGGYLKIRDNTERYSEWWELLSKRDKNTIRSIPNFDAEKFYQITGIKIN